MFDKTLKFLLRVALLGVLATAPACASSVPVPRITLASPEVTRLQILLPPQQSFLGEQLRLKLAARLAGVGYTVIDNPAVAHDIECALTVRVTEKPSMFTVYVDGQRKASYQVDAVMSVRLGAQGLSSASARYDSADEPPSAAVDTLAAAVAHPDMHKVAVFVLRSRQEAVVREQHVRAQREAEEQRLASQKAAKEAEEKRRLAAEEDAAWQAATPARCCRAEMLDACDGVERYLRQHADSPRAAQAKKCLDEAKPGLEDRRDWERANIEECRKAANEDGCDGVFGYVARHPNGMFASIAHEAMDALRARLQAQSSAGQCAGKCSKNCAASSPDDRPACLAKCKATECR